MPPWALLVLLSSRVSRTASSTDRPILAAVRAACSPAAPEPMTRQSARSFLISRVEKFIL